MEKLIKIGMGLLIISLAVLSFTDREIFNGEEEVKTLIEANEVIIQRKDMTAIDSLSGSFGTTLEANEKKISEVIASLKPKVDAKEEKAESKANSNIQQAEKIKQLETAISVKDRTAKDLHVAHLKSMADSKNESLFEYEKQKHKPSANIWLIIFIILTAGVIGGWARMNYSILPPLKSSLTELESKMTKTLNEFKASRTVGDKAGNPTLMTETVIKTETELSALTKKMSDILEEVPDASTRLSTSLVFGIIASSVSLLALKLADSQVLKFESTIDYFILWAWCLLGAVYAKDTLERVYSSRFPKKDN